MTTAELHYAQIKKECLAILFVCSKFDIFLYGRDLLTEESDHKPLETIFKKPKCEAPKRLQRMMMRLQRYNLHVTYKQGKDIFIADMLSRAYLPMTDSHVNALTAEKNDIT